jgi:hypothetical protein
MATRTTLPAMPDKGQMAAFLKKAVELSPQYRTELLKP